MGSNRQSLAAIPLGSHPIGRRSRTFLVVEEHDDDDYDDYEEEEEEEELFLIA